MKAYVSKKAKRRAEFLEREKKRKQNCLQHKALREADTIEEMAQVMGVKLK
jgi:hypothetical protein